MTTSSQFRLLDVMVIGAASIAVLAASLSVPSSAAAPANSAASSTVNAEIEAVTVPPNSADIWALAESSAQGQTTSDQFVVHRHGSKWTKPKIKGLPAGLLSLNGIAAASSKSVWLVGEASSGSSTYTPYVGHSTGGAFTSVALPDFASGTLFAVAASSASNVWLLGEKGDQSEDIALHWNGEKWTQHQVPDTEGSPFSDGRISTSGPSNVWILGSRSDSSDIDHWNGKHWVSPIPPSMTPTYTNIGTSAKVTYLVGYTYASAAHPVAYSWSKSEWHTVALKHAKPGEELQGVALVGSTAYVDGRRLATNSAGTATPTVATLSGNKGSFANAEKVGAYGELYSISASSKVVVAAGLFEAKGDCASPFNPLAEERTGKTWTRIHISPALIPASKTGSPNCA